jgi:hypothetical protein
VLWVPPAAPESAIDRNREGAEQRARTTVLAILAAAQNGTYACAAIALAVVTVDPGTQRSMTQVPACIAS